MRTEITDGQSASQNLVMNQTPQKLQQVVLGLAVKMGLSSNSIDELQVKEFARFIQQMFGYLELSDIPMACDMACAGKLTGIDITKHHRLSNTLIGQMLNSYGSYKRLYVKNVQTPTQEKKVSEDAKEKVFKEEVDYQYNQIKKGVVNRKDYSHKARLFRWLQEKKEEDTTVAY